MQNSHLNDHLKTHAGGKPYKCSQDDEAFTQKCSLICHIKTHDGENHINTANVIRNYVNAANVIRLSYRVAQWLACGTRGAHVGDHTFDSRQEQYLWPGYTLIPQAGSPG